MAQFSEGLNYLPLLARNISPPTTGRSRTSVTKKGSLRSLVYYNGNYEGDITMFKENDLKLNDLDLTDTDSDTDFQNDLQRYVSTRSVNIKSSKSSSSLLWCLLQLCVIRFLSPETNLKISQFIEKFTKTSLYSRIRFCTKCITVLFIWLFRLVTIGANKIGDLSYGLWKSRIIFRNSARRLLWWMTLAKCGDLPFYALILFCTPWLFAIAIFGFIISLNCCLKECLKRMGYFIKTRLI